MCKSTSTHTLPCTSVTTSISGPPCLCVHMYVPWTTQCKRSWFVHGANGAFPQPYIRGLAPSCISLKLLFCAACNSGTNGITVFDFLTPRTSTATPCLWWPANYTTVIRNVPQSSWRPCTRNAFQAVCKSLVQDLFIVYTNPTASVGPARTGEFLTALGLNDITHHVKNVYIYALNVSRPSAMAVFLPSLKYVYGKVDVHDFNRERGNPFSYITQLPGLVSLQYVGILMITRTAFVDMASFSGLKCLNQTLVLDTNAQLTTLAGLESLDTFYSPAGTAPNLIVFGAISNQLSSPDAFRPVIRAAGCPAAGFVIPDQQLTYILVDGCPETSIIQSLTQLCNYISGTAACPVR